MNKIRLSIILFLSVLASSSAFAGVKMSVVASGNYGLTNDTSTGTTIKGGIGYGGGLLFGLPMGNSAFFELGGLYNTYSMDIGGTNSTSSVVHVPVTLHLMLGHALSLGAGGWYDLGLSNSSGSASNTYGAQGGVRLHFSPRVFLDASYTMCLDSSQSVKPSGVLGLLGISFGGAK